MKPGMPPVKPASLNWKEIDLVLKELPLAGSHIQEIHQPFHDRLVFSLFRSSGPFSLLVCLSPRYPRLHTLSEKLPNPAKPFRFAAFLRAHLKGGKIESAAQVGTERIVRLDIRKSGGDLILWLRLWGSAANALLTDPEGIILDAFYRRPKRGEISRGRFEPAAIGRRGPLPGDAGPGMPARTVRKTSDTEYTVRELPGEGNFNERVERYFRDVESKGEGERLRAEIETGLGIRESKVLANREKLEKRLSEYQNLERFKELGDLITSALHRIRKGDQWVKVEDFFHDNVPVEIELKPELSPARNAESYYERYRKARDGMGKVTEEIGHLRRMLAGIEKQRRELAEATAITPDVGAETPVSEKLSRLRKAAQHGKIAVSPETPGLVFSSPPYRIIVGRSAAENDALLRRVVRGNDWWFHARDWPGAYVFVKAPPGKSLPLETMLDAGSLAIHFSKGKGSGAGDVYYTQVKYLRRVKGGKKGLVIPTQEKNLHVRLDEARIERLKGGDSGPD
jgi:predicted ribosome quality control (RQC) complex YloA/Tae2 family protein